MDVLKLSQAFNVGQMAAVAAWLFFYFRDMGKIKERLAAIEQAVKDNGRRH